MHHLHPIYYQKPPLILNIRANFLPESVYVYIKYKKNKHHCKINPFFIPLKIYMKYGRYVNNFCSDYNNAFENLTKNIYEEKNITRIF